jgi:hypothetical protein
MANPTPDQLRQAHKQMQEALRNGSLRRDLQGRRSADSKQRGQADKEYSYDEFGRKIPQPTFLRPEHIAKGESYDVERVLYTTLGQQKGEPPRKITREDIMAFKDNIDLLREQYSKGITIPKASPFQRHHHSKGITIPKASPFQRHHHSKHYQPQPCR